MTVSEAWDLYWEHEASARRSSAEKKRIFEKDVKPVIGNEALNRVTRHELAKLISTKFETAKTASNRLHSLLARFFRWCFTHGQALTGLDANPMASVPKMHSERDSARKRYLTKEELGWWFRSLGAAGDQRNIHELLMRTLCRFSDILDLTWGEVVKRDNGDWVLEIGRTKNNEAHVVYLHPSAVKLLPKRPKSAKPDDRIFNSGSRSGKPVQRLRVAMEKLAAKKGRGVPHWQPHDYRRTGTTQLASMTDQDDNPLVPDHILDRLLAHKEQRVIRHYNRYSYYKEKKSALKLWNDSLDSLRNQQPMNTKTGNK
jgi:integrase